jgi:hypothetical protein
MAGSCPTVLEHFSQYIASHRTSGGGLEFAFIHATSPKAIASSVTPALSAMRSLIGLSLDARDRLIAFRNLPKSGLVLPETHPF